MASVVDAEPWYVSLLGLAETFRTSNPPNIRLCIHCLQSIFNFQPPPRIESRTHLQLGNILLAHTKNLDLARFHLEKAWAISSNLASVDDVRFEAASVLAQVFEKQLEVNLAKPILRRAIEISQQAPYWHCRLLFHLAQIHASEREYASACQLLGVGSDFALTARSDYLRLLFLLSKGMLLLVDKKVSEVKEVLSLSGALIEHYKGSPTQKESLNVFFLVLQVCHYLMSGQVKSVKPCLKLLQQSIQTVTQLHSDDEPLSSNQIDQFQWLPKEHMCVLVYLVTVMHSMQAGYMDKAQKYTDKALMQIEKLKMLDAHPLLSSFQLMLLEHIIMCRLIMGSKSAAIQEIFQACNVCQQQPRLFSTHGAQIHTLLGLYAMSMNCMEAAESQFNTAFKLSSEVDLRTFVKLNLAIVYLRTNRPTNLISLIETVVTLPSKVSSSSSSSSSSRKSTDSEIMNRIGSHSLRASAFYVRGLQAFFQASYSEAKRYLRETLKMANAEDLNRLTSCSLVLLGHIFLSLGNSREAMNMVTPAMQLAGKIPDVHVQLWASSLLKGSNRYSTESTAADESRPKTQTSADLYHLCGDQVNEAEGYRMHTSFSQDLLKDHFQSSQMSEHGLIQWTEGPCPFHLSSEASSSML